MSSKKWLVMFFISILAILLIYSSSNILIDPFGVFGDRILQWYSYDETNNPRVAKISWLDKNHENYDSYIIGSSSASSYPVETLNKYFNARFFNLFAYGCDMYDTYCTAEYVIKNYKPKNIIIDVSLNEGVSYDWESDRVTGSLHANVAKTNKLGFYTKYAFVSWKYSLDKLKAYKNDTFLPQKFDVFNVESGSYDKRVRDVEPIGEMNAYLSKNIEFEDTKASAGSLPYKEECAASLSKIKKLCDANDVNLVVIFSPVYQTQMDDYSQEEIKSYIKTLATSVELWDFSVSPISYDPRYFYDTTHFRNAVGEMMLARIFDDSAVYYPQDFGSYIHSDNVDESIKNMFNMQDKMEAEKNTAQVPILLYHALDEKGNESTVISADLFEKQIKALYDNGYTAVSFNEMMAYVNQGKSLPSKPVCITFDDGYLSNFEIAYPILKKYHMKATIFVIGASVGHTYYKDTDHQITPHFSYSQAREMIDSGLISILSHTYDMHQWTPFETNSEVRTSVRKLDNETESDYIECFANDYKKSSEDIMNGTGEKVDVFSYPLGEYSILSEVVLHSLGVKVTLGTQPGNNTLIKGLPQSLLALHRYTMNESVTVEDMLSKIGE